MMICHKMSYQWTVFLACLLHFSEVSAVKETVNTTSGVVTGIRIEGENVIKFLGIPYAEAPIGERRFKPPIMKARMSGNFNAKVNGFACPQMTFDVPEDLGSPIVNPPMSEDCLNLNIFAPITALKTDPLSVMVWVYGGGYTNGAASDYDPTLIAERNDVIIVVINYRLGILGFLNTVDDNAVGNFGLRDQCLALQWVRDNIEEFGGNRSSVTIFGESAGAGSVTQLTMAASCEGLFHRVIAQSGSPLMPWAYNVDPLKSARELGNSTGCPTENTTSLVQCLRGKTTDELLKHQPLVLDILGNAPWVPSYVGDFFSFVPKELQVWRGIPIENKMADFDLMTGFNMEEGEMFYEFTMAPLRAKNEVHDKTEGLSERYLENILSYVARGTLSGDHSQADKLLPSLKFQYTDWKNANSKYANSKMLITLMSDILFNADSVKYARLHAEFGRPPTGDHSGRGRTYFYQLRPHPTWVPDPWKVGAMHTDDVSFLFDTFSARVNSTLEEKYLSHVMTEYWTNFAKTGNPNEPSKRYIVTDWAAFSLADEEYIELDINMTRDSIDKHPYARRVAFWNEFIPEQVQLFTNDADRKQCESETTSSTTTPRHVTHDEVQIIG